MEIYGEQKFKNKITSFKKTTTKNRNLGRFARTVTRLRLGEIIIAYMFIQSEVRLPQTADSSRKMAAQYVEKRFFAGSP